MESWNRVFGPQSSTEPGHAPAVAPRSSSRCRAVFGLLACLNSRAAPAPLAAYLIHADVDATRRWAGHTYTQDRSCLAVYLKMFWPERPKSLTFSF